MSEPQPPQPPQQSKATRTRRNKVQRDTEDDDEQARTDAAGKAIVDALRSIKRVFSG